MGFANPGAATHAGVPVLTVSTCPSVPIASRWATPLAAPVMMSPNVVMGLLNPARWRGPDDVAVGIDRQNWFVVPRAFRTAAPVESPTTRSPRVVIGVVFA